jgi:hypothetical protein
MHKQEQRTSQAPCQAYAKTRRTCQFTKDYLPVVHTEAQVFALEFVFQKAHSKNLVLFLKI